MCYHMSGIPTLFPPALWDLYLGALSEYPFWYIHTCISHISSFCSFISVSSVWFLCIFFGNLYSRSSHWNFWSFSFFWWTFISSKRMYFKIYLFRIFVFTWGTLISVLSLNLNIHMVSLQGTKDIDRYLGRGVWQNYQGLYWISFFPPQDGFPKSPIITLVCS